MAAAVEQEKLPAIADVLERARGGKLWGRKCARCANITFIDTLRCTACRGLAFEAFESKGAGEVLSFTVIAFPAEAFAAHGPFAFVVVKMAEGGATTGWMPSVHDPRELRVGDAVRIVASPFGGGIAFEKA